MAVTLIDSARCALRHLSARTGLLPYIVVAGLLMVALLLAAAAIRRISRPPRHARCG